MIVYAVFGSCDWGDWGDELFSIRTDRKTAKKDIKHLSKKHKDYTFEIVEYNTDETIQEDNRRE